MMYPTILLRIYDTATYGTECLDVKDAVRNIWYPNAIFPVSVCDPGMRTTNDIILLHRFTISLRSPRAHEGLVAMFIGTCNREPRNVAPPSDLLCPAGESYNCCMLTRRPGWWPRFSSARHCAFSIAIFFVYSTRLWNQRSALKKQK